MNAEALIELFAVASGAALIELFAVAEAAQP
jgi:hypothetical protein